MIETTIPGPSELPWIGSVHKLAANPTGFLQELAANYGSMARFTMFGEPIVLVSDPALIRQVLVERVDEFPKAPRDLRVLSPYLGQGLLTNNGASHRQRRKLVQPAFHHKRIQHYGEIMVDYTQEMLDRWQDGTVQNVSDEMMHLTLFIVAKSLFNEDPEEMAKLADTIGHAVHELQAVADEDFETPWRPPLSWPTPGSRRRRALQNSLHTTVDGLIAKRLATSADGEIEDRGDLLSMLLLSKDEEGNRLSLEEVRDEVITILLAGHETTSNTMTWAFYLLGKHPEIAAKLFAEVDGVLAGRAPTLADLPKLPYTNQVVKETMRHRPPAWLLNGRYTHKGATLGDYTLKAGTSIFISPYVLHHLPRYFDAPEEFRPERFTPEFEDALPKFAYMPFGGGPRICIGNSFAMMEAQLILATICNRFVLQPVSDAVAVLNPQITLSIRDGLLMRAVARSAQPGQVEGVGESALPEAVLA